MNFSLGFPSFSKQLDATQDLRRYLAEASLPQIRLAPSTPMMPPENHKSHRNNLTVRPERYRRLEQMYRLNDEYMEDDTANFIETFVQSGSLANMGIRDTDPDTGETISVPCSGFTIPNFLPPPMQHIEEMGVSWMGNFALRTVQRILQVLPKLPDAKRFGINRPDESRDMDQALFRYFTLNQAPETRAISEPTDPCALIVAYQPPWILSPQDLKQFTRTNAIPTYHEREGSVPATFNSAQRVWAKLWDICHEKNCRFFVLTNYSQWVFGAFSRGWTRGFVSDIKTNINKNPSLLEYILYWFVSAMGIQGVNAFVIPEVPEVVQALDPQFSTPPQTPRQFPTHPVQYPASESYWSGIEDEAGSSAGVDTDGLEVGTPPGREVIITGRLKNRTELADLSQIPMEFIEDWLLNGDPTTMPVAPPPIPNLPSPAPSDWSGTSVSTVTNANRNGYLSSNTPVGVDNRFT